jgi:DMSO/TMAO reductase YedYZ molybdopterin-dependent catalytic subunit
MTGKMGHEGFSSFRLKVGGLVEHPVELSLADLAKMGSVEDITMHHCIQGWSGIAKWGGLPMKTLVELVKPKPNAKVVAFFSFGGSMFGDLYYDTQSLQNVLKAECMLASEMNDGPLTEQYDAPLRLRVENQLGFKMIKWIERIEFIESEKTLGKAKAAPMRMTNTSTSCPTSDDHRHSTRDYGATSTTGSSTLRCC